MERREAGRRADFCFSSWRGDGPPAIIGEDLGELSRSGVGSDICGFVVPVEEVPSREGRGTRIRQIRGGRASLLADRKVATVFATTIKIKIPKPLFCNDLGIIGCGQGRIRTADTRLFRPLLYHLSYLTIGRAPKRTCRRSPSFRRERSIAYFSTGSTSSPCGGFIETVKRGRRSVVSGVAGRRSRQGRHLIGGVVIDVAGGAPHELGAERLEVILIGEFDQVDGVLGLAYGYV